MTVIDDRLGLIDAEDPTAQKEVLVEARREIERLTALLGTAPVDLVEARRQVDTERHRAEVAERGIEIVQESHRSDIARIGAALLEEAEDRDWCGDYDRVIERLNERLNVPLPTRLKQFTITTRVTFEQDFTVEAHTQEEAEELIEQAERSTSWRVSSPFVSSEIEQSGIYGHSIEVEIV